MDNVADTRHRLCLIGVEALDFSAKYRALDHARNQHPGTLHVDAEGRFTVHFFRNIKPLQRLAQQTEFFRTLQRNRFRNRKRRGLFDQRAVSQTAPAGFVDDFALLCGARIFLHVPGLSSGGDQHCPRRAPSLPQDPPHAANTVAAGRQLCATEIGITVFGVRRHPLGFDLVPVHIEFFGQEHRHRGHHALAHFQLRQHDGDCVVGADLDPDIWFQSTSRFGCAGFAQAGNIPAHEQRAACRAHF